MNEKAVLQAEEIIQSKTGYTGGGMEGYCVLAVIDEEGYPSASTVSISKADGLKRITFLSGLSSNKAKRIRICNRGSVCISSSAYSITLVGTLEVLTDPATKREMWQKPLESMYSGPDDPEYCVIRFTTRRYKIFIVYGQSGLFAEGSI